MPFLSVTKSQVIAFCPVQNMNDPFLQGICYLPVSHLAVLVIRLTGPGITVLVFEEPLFYLRMGSKHKSSDTGNLDMLKRCHEVLAVSKKICMYVCTYLKNPLFIYIYKWLEYMYSSTTGGLGMDPPQKRGEYCITIMVLFCSSTLKLSLRLSKELHLQVIIKCTKRLKLTHGLTPFYSFNKVTANKISIDC